jgi:hypothetical protein
MKTQVQYLKTGDKLTASGATIVNGPWSDLSTPSGKVKIGVRYPKETEGSVRIWNKRTEVIIERNDCDTR